MSILRPLADTKNHIYIHSLDELEKEIQEWKKTKGLTFLYMKISKGSKPNLGRPKVTPCEVKTRLQNLLDEKDEQHAES